jgi:S1-C subfamily serine protease
LGVIMNGSGLVWGRLGCWSRGGVLAGALLASGCAAQTVEAAFADDFQCRTGVDVEESAAMGRFRASGCGREATYQCVTINNFQTICDLQTANSEPARERSSEQPSQRRSSAPPLAESPEVRVGSKGQATLVLELKVGKAALFRLSAAPDKLANLVQLKLIRNESSEDTDECNLDFMINGQVLKTPKSVAAREGKLLSHRVQVGKEIVSELSVAEKISFRVCRQRFSLDREQVAAVRDFMERYHEEMAWKGEPREAGTAGMLAPTGGWPVWAAAVGQPVSVEGTGLDAPDLFKKLSASVFKLEAARADGPAQGSAVAVNASELITNCHVVQGAMKLTLKQGKQEWAAKVVRADPKTDRCVITSDHPKLAPVAGVRAYDSLQVGEKVYTLGSPVGLELTLSDGIISGRRDVDDFHFVQTTAPISPGSSGGGLFDARGNLIGVTTLVLAGRERLNQALNFAIPADAFWQK